MRLLKDLEQDTEAWHARRSVSIGSSDASVIMECDPYRTYEELLSEKRGIKRDFKMNDAMRLGKRWEGAAREMFNLYFNQDVRPVVGVHDHHDFLIASFDGLYEERKFFVEIKYAGHKKVDQLVKDHKIPEHHYAQMQHQFLVSGYLKAYYIVYALSSKQDGIAKIHFLEVEPDQPYIDRLLELECLFWSRLNDSQTTPLADTSQSSSP